MTNRELEQLWAARRDKIAASLYETCDADPPKEISLEAAQVVAEMIGGLAAAVEAMHCVADSYDAKASEEEFREEQVKKNVADAAMAP